MNDWATLYWRGLYTRFYGIIVEKEIMTPNTAPDHHNGKLKNVLFRLQNLEHALEVSRRDIDSEREMQDILRKRYVVMKTNFDM